MRLLTRTGAAESRTKGLSSARARFERRAARARRRPRLVAVLLVLTLLLAGGAVWLGWFSSLLLAERVEVRGVKSSQAATVRDVAAVPLGGPLMRVDTDAAVDRLERDLRWIEVSVTRSLPHTVVIEVTPRVAVLAVRMRTGEVQLHDREGVAFRTVAAPPDGLPLVSSTGSAASPEGVEAVLQALAALDGKVRKTVSEVSLESGDRVTLTLTSKGAERTVRWGGPGDAALKARLVTILLKEPGQLIDVTVPEAPVTR